MVVQHLTVELMDQDETEAMVVLILVVAVVVVVGLANKAEKVVQVL